MANTSNNTRTSLKARVAAETSASTQGKTAKIQEAKMRVAACWTIAKTMLPNAPVQEQFKFAKALQSNSTPALRVALKQTAINAHWTRIAEQFAQVHKVDLNDLLEEPSILTKEKKNVESELKGDPKAASAKKADDRKDAGPLPTEYPEPKREEPAELDGSNAGKGRPESWTEGPTGEKKAGKKQACSEGCTGDCDHKKEASEKKACPYGCKGECDHMKEAAAKTAENGEESPEEGGAPQSEVDDEIEAAADGAAKGAEDAAEGDAPVEGEEKSEEKPEEKFDPEITNLEEAAADLEADTQRIQDAIAGLSGESGDLTFNTDAEDENLDFFGEAHEGTEPTVEGEGVPEGEELNLDDIFDPNNMSDKVSALNDEPHGEEGEVMFEYNDGDDFFAPSDPAELESVLEQEEELSSPASMFAIEGVDNDPLARIFASSSKQAADEADIVKPGEFGSFFETDLKGDDRDWDHDHEGSIFEDVLMSLKQVTRDDHRDTEPHLMTPKGTKEAKNATPAPVMRSIKQKSASAKAATPANLASLIFTDDADYL